MGPFLRLQLHVAVAVQRVGIRPHGTVLHQSIFCERASAHSVLAVSSRLERLAAGLSHARVAEGEEMKLGYGIKAWTPEEEERLRSMISEGLRPHEIAVKLHRTVEAVYARAKRLRLSFKQRRLKAKK